MKLVLSNPLTYTRDMNTHTDIEAVEALSKILHDIYQKEAHRQEDLGIGNVRHYDEYEKLSEPVKEFDRVLARYILEREASHQQKLLTEIEEELTDKMMYCKSGAGCAYKSGIGSRLHEYECVWEEIADDAYIDCTKHKKKGICKYPNCTNKMKSKHRCKKCGELRYSNYCTNADGKRKGHRTIKPTTTK